MDHEMFSEQHVNAVPAPSYCCVKPGLTLFFSRMKSVSQAVTEHV